VPLPMTAALAPDRRKLSQVTRELVRPEGIVSTGFGPVEKRCVQMGVTLDEWQRGIGKLVLAKTSDGNYAATVGGVGLSLPRQVGKTYTIGSITFALCTLVPGLTVVWTSHHMKTTGETFLFMQGFAKRMRVAPFIDNIYLGSGDEEIRFTNGSRILFGARERGFGRGIAGVDILICDEGQILSEKALDNMLATLNTSNQCGGLAIFMGTPPKPEDTSDAFARMRREAIDGDVTDTAWIECGADPNADPDDRRQWAKANASYPYRTPLTSMLRLRRKLTTESWLREGLGIWQDYDALRKLDLARWAKLRNVRAPEPNRAALVVDVSPDNRWASIGIAGKSFGDRVLVMCKSGRGIGWVTDAVMKLRTSKGITEIALVMGGQARGLQAEFHTAGLEFHKMTQVDVSASCVAWQLGMKSKTIVHLGQGELDLAVANARLRPFGESEIWDRTRESLDISPVVACAAAYHRWGLSQTPTPTIV
jgi:hypothetical protein